MSFKTLVLHPEKCTGCGDCIDACALKHTVPGNPGRSCIKIMNENGMDDFFLPVTCQQCENPPCLAACPNEAIYRDNELNRVMISHDKCVGCKMCYSACPFGAMGFNENKGKSFKCDLCDGDPECARVCKEGAVEYSGTDMLKQPQMAFSAAKLTRRIRPIAA